MHNVNGGGDVPNCHKETAAHEISTRAMQLSQFTLYETPRAFWIVSSSPEQSQFEVLKIAPRPDGTERSPRFAVEQLDRVFSVREIQRWLQQQTDDEGLRQRAPPAYGLLGVIRFTGCYYLALVTKCSLVSLLGGNKIYHIDETALVPLVHSSVYEEPDRRSAEGRLIATFHSLDLARTFYFSLTYDLTNTLQTNLNATVRAEREAAEAVEKAAAEKGEKPAVPTQGKAAGSKSAGSKASKASKAAATASAAGATPAKAAGLTGAKAGTLAAGGAERLQSRKNSAASDGANAREPLSERRDAGNFEVAADVSESEHSVHTVASRPAQRKDSDAGRVSESGSRTSVGVLDGASAVAASDDSEPLHTPQSAMFVWNSYLLSPLSESGPFVVSASLRRRWFLSVIHGFIDQARISVFGNQVTITLIARRSHHFAGVRFYKRGVNNDGYPANEVETEQIVSNELASQFSGRYTSYVQHRGSICVNWSQTSNNMSPQPPIRVDQADPFYTSAAKHFDRMFCRYGVPIRILNLVKTKEKRPRESLLSKEFELCVQYLSQFLPPHRAGITPQLASRVFSEVHPVPKPRKALRLEGGCIEYTHWDMSRAAKSRASEVMDYLGRYANETLEVTSFFQPGVSNQQGVCRTNCIDCLDRTNAAQSVIAKYALGYQLCALGIIDKPRVEYDTDVIDLLTEMYHDHGDTIALQYGGSNLVNTVETYRKINHWSSHSRDLIESVKRYYTNSFVDAQRQDAINVFLGKYQYVEGVNLWDLRTDYYLHNATPRFEQRRLRSYRQWYEPRHLMPAEQPVNMVTTLKPEEDCFRFTSLDDLFTSRVNSIDKYSQSTSPFEVHARKRKRRIEATEMESSAVREPERVPREKGVPDVESEYARYLLAPKTALATSVSVAADYKYKEYFNPVTTSIAAYTDPDTEWLSGDERGLEREYHIYAQYTQQQA